VYRTQGASGAERLIAVSLTGPMRSRFVYGSQLAGEVGRPSVDGASLVFAVGTPARSAIEGDELNGGPMRTLRAVRGGVALSNPSLLGRRLLFERTTRCYQQLRIGAVNASGRSRSRERTLLSLPSTVYRDPGYQRGYTHAYNGASKCPNRAAGRGGAMRLGPTALSAGGAYVTVSNVAGSDARIATVGR
jgi:hypothetical protein